MGMFYMTQRTELGLCNNLEGWNGEEDGREIQEEGNICILITDLHRCMAETDITL